jgi:hypothetical protein
MVALAHAVEAVHRGDLKGPEALLSAQAISLNTIFTRLALVALQNMSSKVNASERLMRLAFKAQGQCRATVETLAMIKNPPTIFARQANIANGPQQVNNGLPAVNCDTQQLARAGNLETGKIELLEAHGERLDVGTTDTTGAGDQALATVGTRNRPPNS